MVDEKQREEPAADEHDRLTAELRAAGIDPTKFGFYDQPAFVAMEKRDRIYIQKYAEWVITRPLNAAYEAHARTTVPKLAAIIASELAENAMSGACITAYGMMVRMLDRLGVWSFGLYGSANLDVPHRGLRQSFHAIDGAVDPASVTGHAWLCAPPYLIVDSSLALQDWDHAQMVDIVPPSIVVDDTAATVIEPTVEDCASEGARHYHGRRLQRTGSDLLHSLEPRLASFGQRFPAHEVALGELSVRYVPVAIRLPNLSLEHINLETGWGRSAITIWVDVVAPAFGLS
ncbi:hypothetical protein Y88_3348 [Novosphingobium nitrogenifigens DSM 19370]|uniref:Uncharacterized protein n=1 Tax=Novosphingobium nitrogenifigens DSM 19370 TaxID=983920 RepID=F1ZBQ6_9SPHN|nr:hypothetical protein [Novosphingobium nitrogenifigens]EGD58018.1 hypothetical protein Y88_3348 [Novosphingobium nitrogenifigens DSM 19370]